MTFARLQGGAYTRLGRNLRERVWGTKSPCRFAAPPLTCGPAFGAPAGIQRFKYAPSSVTASPCHLPPSGGKACGRVWVPYGQIGTFRGGRVRAPAPTKYGELSGLSIGAGHWPARRRPLAAHLIRPLRGHLPLKGKAFGRPRGSPLRWETNRERWLGSGRRGSGTAPVPISLLLRPPVGPDGTALRHS